MVALPILAVAILAGSTAAQTYRRAAACPNLGCIYPPVRLLQSLPLSSIAWMKLTENRIKWISSLDVRLVHILLCHVTGWWANYPETFDIRVEVQAPVNGSEAYNGGTPSPDFSVVIAGEGAEPVDITQFFQLEDPKGESIPTITMSSVDVDMLEGG